MSGNTEPVKSFLRISAIGACIFLIFLIPLCSNGNQSKTVSNSSQGFSAENYDGVYSGFKFYGDGHRYKSCEGTFRNLTGKRIKNLGVQVSFFDGNSKLQISNDSIDELGAGEDWRFKFKYVDATANTFRVDSFTGSYGVNRYSELNVISEESYLEKTKNKPPTEEELSEQVRQKERKTEFALVESNKTESIKQNKIKKQLESKYRGVRLRAESGGVQAMFELSEMLRNGIGCETNIDESNQWLNKFNQNKQSEAK